MESQEEAESWNDEEAASWNDDEGAESWNAEEGRSWNEEEEAETEHPESETLVKPVPYRGSVKQLLEMAANRKFQEEVSERSDNEWRSELQFEGDVEDTKSEPDSVHVKSEPFTPPSSPEEKQQEKKKRKIDHELLEDLALFKGNIVYRHRPFLAARVKAAARMKAEPKRLPKPRSS